ncbi:MAG: heparinase II/III family protein [Planctomycetota bacterium]|nr:heparinase II/III family protein [Planctomycetota bacterium]
MRPGENRLKLAIPVEMLAEGENTLQVDVVANPGNTTILSRTIPVTRESPEVSVARILCEHVDWSRPDLKQSACAAAWRNGRAEAAALEFVRHLRRRATPHMGYTKQFVAQLRAHATPAFRAKARAEIDSLLGGGFLGGSYPDGRGTLLAVRPEVLQLAAEKKHFDLFARILTSRRQGWGAAATHTSVNVLRFMQAAWPLEECSDEALIPVLGFLAKTHRSQWEGAKTWDDASHGQAHNWWAYEFSGSWKASLLFPELAGFAKFAALFPDNFEREARLLFFPDGFTREVSTSYHIGTVDIFFEIARVARLNGLTLSPAFHQRLRAAAEVEWKLMQPDGNYPAFGDCFNDGPHVLERARSMAAIGGIPECKFLAESLDAARPSNFGAMMVEELNYPGIGEDLRPAYDALQARAPAEVDQALEQSGYYAMRQDWSAKADYAAVEASPRGRIDTSHGHSAIFDLRLCARGRAILVGNGKGPDDHGSPPRLWRVSAASHSCAIADGEEPVPLRSVYRFAREVAPVVVDWQSRPGHAYFHGTHEAYNNIANPVRAAHRKLFYLRGKYWILLDRFVSGVQDAAHVYRQFFQVGVPSRLETDGRCVTSGAGGNLVFMPINVGGGVAGRGAGGGAGVGTPVESSKSRCPFPLEGYPVTEQLCYTHRAAGHGLLATLLLPFTGEPPPNVSARMVPIEADDRLLSPQEATAIEITFAGERHLYVDFHAHWHLPWRCAGLSGATRLFHSAV